MTEKVQDGTEDKLTKLLDATGDNLELFARVVAELADRKR